LFIHTQKLGAGKMYKSFWRAPFSVKGEKNYQLEFKEFGFVAMIFEQNF